MLGSVDAASILESISDRYAHGECGAFAMACYQRYRIEGWHLVLFWKDRVPLHAACQTPEGAYFDAYGFVSLEQIQARYGVTLDPEETDEAGILAAMGFEDDDVSEAEDHLRLLEEVLLADGAARRWGSMIYPAGLICFDDRIECRPARPRI